MNAWVKVVAVGALSVLAVQAPLAAQSSRVYAQGPERAGVVVMSARGIESVGANDLRQELRRLLERYPPSLGRVLKLDPTLLTNPGYLASYPALAEFLKQYPEVARSPAYFLSFVNEPGNSLEPTDPTYQIRSQTLRMWEDTMAGIFFFLVFLTVAFTLGWLVKYIVGHRRWLRTTKIQTEVHTRLLERFSANEELLAYVQSPAGSRFLQAPPATADIPNGSGMSAPFTRILWSVQAGLVLAVAGAGMLMIRRHLLEEVSQMLLVIGTLALSIGIGFALAAIASYMLSNRLGLFDRTQSRSDAGA